MSQQQTLLRVQTNIPSTVITGTTTYEYLDLYDDIPIKINKSFAELQDIASRNSDYSVNLLLPGSKKNNRFFEGFYDVDIDTFYFNANNRVECNVILDSKSLFKGYLRLNKVNIMDSKVEYDVTLYSEMGNLYGKIGNNLLKDLNFDDSEYTFNHTFGVSAIDSKLFNSNFFVNNTNPFTYFYPIVHNGYNYESVSGATLPDFTGATVSRRTRLYTPTSPITGWSGATPSGIEEYRINSPTQALYDNQLKPALNIYSLIQLIFKTYGYTITSDFMNTPWMKSLYMYGYFSSDATKFGYKIVSIDSLPLEGVELIYSGSTVPGSSLNIIICKRGTGIPCYCLDDVNYGFANMFPYSEYGTIASGLSGLTITAVEGFDFGFEVDGVPVADISTLKYAPAAVGSSVAFIDGDPVNFSLVIDENIKQIDLLSSIAKKFNLVFVPNPDKPNDIIIEPFDFYIGTGDIQDWTDKISYDGGITVEPALNYVESELILTDLEDGDEGNKEFKTRNNRIYGVSKNPNPTDFKTETKTIDTIFSPELVRQWDTLGPAGSSLIGLPLGINYAAASEISSFDNQVRWVYNGIKTKPKLFFWMMGVNPFIDSVGEVYDKYVGGGNTYTVKIMNWSGGTINGYDRIPSISHTMPLGLADQYKINNDSLSILFNSEETVEGSVSLYNSYTENDMYNTFYKNRITNIYNPNTRFLSGKFNLSYADIANIKANDVIRLKNQYFIVNKINEFNYTNSELTSVELLQFNVNPQNYPTRYFKYYYCENPSVCFNIKTDFNNPNLRSTNFIWSIYYDNQVGSLTGSTTGFTSSLKILDLDGAIEELYFPYTMQEITEAEYNSNGCYDFSLDPVMQYVYENIQGLSYSLAGFWVNSGSTKTGVNVWESCADFYTTASTYGILTGTTATYGPPGTCFNNFRHINSGTLLGAGQVRELQLGRNGNIFVGGNFNFYSGSSLGTQANLIKIYNNGVRNTGFTHPDYSAINNIVFSIEIDSNDKLYIGGGSANGLRRLNTNGSIDTSFNGGNSGITGGSIVDIEILQDGSEKLIIGGSFTTYNGTIRRNLAKINTDGTLDTSFNSYFLSGFTSEVYDIDVFESGTYAGKIVCGGFIVNYSGVSKSGLIVLNNDGTLYSGFLGTGFTDNYWGDVIIWKVKTFSDGTFLVAGEFTSYNGTPVNGMVKLNMDGTLNTGFTCSLTNVDVFDFDLQSDGKIVLVYSERNPGRGFPSYLVRLNEDGSYDYTFNKGNPNTPSVIFATRRAESILIAGDDTIYYGGNNRYYTNKNPNNIINTDSLVITAFGSGDTSLSGTYTRFTGATYGYYTLPSSFSGNTEFNGQKFTVWNRFANGLYYTLIMTDARPDGDTVEWSILTSGIGFVTNGAPVGSYNQFIPNQSLPIIDDGYSYPPTGVYTDSLNRTYTFSYPETITKEVWSLVKLDRDGNFINCG